MAGLTEYQKDILIRTALGEAGGEGDDGMADVLHVILNRAASGKFPSDPAKVALQDKQFSSWNSGAGGNNPSKWSASSAAYQKAARVLEQVATGSKPDQTGGALYFHTPSVSPSWAKGVNTNGKIVRNGHVFYPTTDNPSVATALDTQRPSPTPATPSAAVTAARNKQNMTPAADLQAMDRHKGAAFLSKDGQKVIDTAGIVFGDQMTTRLPGSGPSASDKVRAAAVQPAAHAVSASDKARAAAVAPRPAAVAPRPAVSASDMARGNTPPVAAPKPATSASDKVRGTNGWETIATIPTTAVGGPPTTRKVQSIPITAPTQPTKPTQPSNIASARSEQAAARGLGTPKVTPAASPLASALTPTGAPLAVPGPVPAAPTAAIIAARQPKKVAPVPAVRQAIVPPVAPRQAASVAVATARSVVPAPAATTVAAFQAQGMTAAQAYDAANKAAKDRAEAGATKGHTSSGGMKYDPDSGGWKWTG